jgi:isoaspartyl peptidase/L-asparaginase-like protein (Ntn-hydrolase superfamily)
MTSRGYTVLGWLVWQIGSRVAKRKISQNKAKLGAVGAVALVLVGGVVAAKSASGDE